MKRNKNTSEGQATEEMVQATLISSIQSANSMLHSAHEGILPR
jgi:hypothetical protein